MHQILFTQTLRIQQTKYFIYRLLPFAFFSSVILVVLALMLSFHYLCMAFPLKILVISLPEYVDIL